MNRARVAALFAALADEFARPDGEEQLEQPEEDRPSRPRRRARTIVAPPGEADELTRARAKRVLREHGFAETKR